jgi:hypothetical protein
MTCEQALQWTETTLQHAAALGMTIAGLGVALWVVRLQNRSCYWERHGERPWATGFRCTFVVAVAREALQLLSKVGPVELLRWI